MGVMAAQASWKNKFLSLCFGLMGFGRFLNAGERAACFERAGLANKSEKNFVVLFPCLFSDY